VKDAVLGTGILFFGCASRLRLCPAVELKTVANNRLDDLNVAFLTGRRDHGQLFTAHCAGIANDTIVTANSVQLAQSA
jgi:hypothetical protein